MSAENVDLFLRSGDAFNRRDLAGWLEGYDPEIVFEPQVAQFEGSFKGHDGLRLFFDNIGEDFESFQVEFDEVRDLGDRVLAVGTAEGRGRGSGIDNQGPVAIVASFWEGKITRFKDYGERDRALRAAGLSE
jgi:ketosteroid isomerase-like protein